MATKGKFRIPTLDEKDKIESNLTKGIKPLFKKDIKSDDSRLQEKSSVLPPKHSSVPTNTNNSNIKHIDNIATKTLSSGTTDGGKQNEQLATISKPSQPTANSSHEERKGNSSFKTNQSSVTKAISSEQDPESLPTLAKIGKTNSLIVNQRQRGNPILKHVRNVPWEFGNIVPDYVMGHSTCALFLSLRYHQLNPEYIHKRLKLLGKSFDLRVLLVQVDIKDPHHLLKDLAKMCILADCTLILAFSPEEAGRYLETYKVYENKPPEVIMEKSENNFMAKMTDCLTTVKSVNKTDCMTLMTTFGSLEKVMKASRDELSLCPGFGPQKAQRLHHVFHEPFLRVQKRKSDDIKESLEEPKPSTAKTRR